LTCPHNTTALAEALRNKGTRFIHKTVKTITPALLLASSALPAFAGAIEIGDPITV
jgi:hypothetical protein